MAHDTGFPPKVLKYSIPLSNASAIALVVTTAPIGWPFPIGFPSVTMSGITSWVSYAHQCEPTRPKPTCTSSATQMAPASRTCPKAASRYPSGRTTWPAHPGIDSAKNAATDRPPSTARRSSPATASAYLVAASGSSARCGPR